MKTILAALALAAAGAPALAQSTVSAGHRFTWQENTGWMNWRDANGGAQGVSTNGLYMAGYIWCENVGWLSVGDGTPGGGAAYTNSNAADAGVNILASLDLSGLAWGENIGWVNFDTGAALGPQRARYDAGSGRLRGYAWGENIGWINLDDPAQFVAFCPVDFNGDGRVNVQDYLAFLSAYSAASPACDLTGDGAIDVQDYLAFLSAYAAGCI